MGPPAVGKKCGDVAAAPNLRPIRAIHESAAPRVAHPLRGAPGNDSTTRRLPERCSLSLHFGVQKPIRKPSFTAPGGVHPEQHPPAPASQALGRKTLHSMRRQPRCREGAVDRSRRNQKPLWTRRARNFLQTKLHACAVWHAHGPCAGVPLLRNPHTNSPPPAPRGNVRESSDLHLLSAACAAFYDLEPSAKLPTKWGHLSQFRAHCYNGTSPVPGVPSPTKA
ncbi:MAG: hypothetical protein RLZZ399_2668 [Verrucomicrobiota bacterium]|jgi:hypothetical protein